MGEENVDQSQTSQACQGLLKQYEKVVDQTLRVQTLGGVYEVQWSAQGKATAMGQLAFFCRVFTSKWFVRTLAAKLPTALHQSERACGQRRSGHVAAGYFGRPRALRAHRHLAR